MDTTDPDIVFDEKGVCNHCHSYDVSIRRDIVQGREGKERIDEIVNKIKKENRHKK